MQYWEHFIKQRRRVMLQLADVPVQFCFAFLIMHKRMAIIKNKSVYFGHVIIITIMIILRDGPCTFL